MSDNIRVGLIGYGYASKTFHAPLIAGTPGLELAVISSSDETKVKADWPTVAVVSEPKHLFNDPNIDTVMACKFFPGPVSRIAGMPDTAPSGAVFFIPSAIFTPLPDYAVTHRTARLTSALHTPPVPACASSRRESPFLSCH